MTAGFLKNIAILTLAGALCLACGSKGTEEIPTDPDKGQQPGGNGDNGGNGDGGDPQPYAGPVAAFPGAEGFGMYTTGGRGGKVYYVINLNDSGAGSLRWALSQSGKRTILFAVSGDIPLLSNIKITNGDVTVAGQSAPGDGICLKNFTLQVAAENVIIRFLRFRPGDYVVEQNLTAEPDAAEGQGVKNIIIDHCSMSWSIDELSSWYANENFTLQWCMLYGSLRNSGHSKGAHGYTGLWGGNKASFHHNLVAHSDSRNPRVAHPLIEEGKFSGFVPGVVDIRNNVFYNWGDNSGYGGEGRKVNLVHNYYKPGTGTKSTRKTQIFEPYWTSETAYKENSSTVNYIQSALGIFYAAGNTMEGSAAVTSDNWAGFAAPKDGAGGNYRINSSTKITAVTATAQQIAAMKLTSPLDTVNGYVKTHTAAIAYAKVPDYAGACQWREGKVWRDAPDSLASNETRQGLAPKRASGTTPSGGSATAAGMIDKVLDMGGYPVLTPITAPADSDNDGIPDAWAIQNGLTHNNTSNPPGPKYTLDPERKYTNLELYLNSLVEDLVAKQR